MPCHQINGAKLPSNRQVLAVYFYNIREVKLSVRESANLAIRECVIFWEKARIPIKAIPNCVKKLLDKYTLWKKLQKNCKKSLDIYRTRENDFENDLDNLFDIAHADALVIMKIEEDKIFLKLQREPGRPGCLAGIDKNMTDKEERSRKRLLHEETRKLRQKELSTVASTSTSNVEHRQVSDEDEIFNSDTEDPPYSHEDEILTETSPSLQRDSSKRGRKNLITPKVVAVLDRCQLSIRDSVYIIQAILEALDLRCDEYSINKSSIQRIRTQMRKSRAETIKTDFKNNVPNVVTIHWDGKLLPGLDVRSRKEERLPIVISYSDKEQLLAVPKLESSSGKDQEKAIRTVLYDWNLIDKVQIICCDTTSTNTGRFNGACALLEQSLERDLVLFACRHHVYELVLKGVFEVKIKQSIGSPEIQIFKKIRDNWKNIDSNKIEPCIDFVRKHISDEKILSNLMFYKAALKKTFIRDDYRELIELCVVFLDGDPEKKIKIKPPGALHKARWMARAIYSLKICLLQSQVNIAANDKSALRDICVFVAIIYVKPWLECTEAVKAPNQDLRFLKEVKGYNEIDETISIAAVSKFCNHLWYLSEEAVILSLFDDEVDNETKTNIIVNLNREKISDFNKRYIPTNDEMSKTLFGESQLCL